MKKRKKKNHIIITALAIMIAAAGYINYAGDLDNIIKVKDKEKAAAVVADNVSTDSNEAEAADTDFTDEPGNCYTHQQELSQRLLQLLS